MSNSFYNHGGYPSTGAAGSSASARAEFATIALAFDKLPALAGNAGKVWVVNSGGTGVDAVTSLNGVSLGQVVAAPGSFTTLSASLAAAFSSTLSVAGASALTGNVTLGGTLGVTGAATLSSTLGVTGATTLSSTLAVTGASTLTGNVAMGGTLSTSGLATLSSLSVTGTSAHTGASTFGSTVGITGAVTLSSTLAVSGGLTASNNLTVGGTLGVSGTATFSAGGSFGGALSVGGTLSMPNNTAIAMKDSGGTSRIFGYVGSDDITNLVDAVGNGIRFLNQALNTEYARFSSLGLGLGMLPTYQLSVHGTGQDTAALADSGAKGGSLYLRATGTGAGSGGALLFGTTFGNSTPFAAIKGLVANGSTNTIGHLAFSVRANVANTSLTEVMRIDEFGNVGIGTQTPLVTYNSKLAVVGTASASNFLLSNQATSTAGSMGFSNSNGPTQVFWGSATGGAGSLETYTSGLLRMTLTAAGNLNLGAAISAAGTVSGANFLLGTQIGSNAGAIGFNNANGPSHIYYGSATVGAGSLETHTGGVMRTVIASNGNMGIAATASASQLLTIGLAGTANFTGMLINRSSASAADAAGSLRIVHNNVSTSNAFLNLVNSTGDVFRVNGDGTTYIGNLVGIGTASPQRPLHIAAAEPAIVFEETDQAVDNRRTRIYGTGSTLAIGIVNDAFTLGQDGYFMSRANVDVTGHDFYTHGASRLRVRQGAVSVMKTTGADYTVFDVEGLIGSSAAPNASWHFGGAVNTSSGTYVAIANNATYDLAVGSGKVFIMDDAGVGAAELFTHYGSTAIQHQYGVLFTTSLGTAGKINIYYNAGTNKYRIQNLSGVAVNLWITTLRLRAGS